MAEVENNNKFDNVPILIHKAGNKLRCTCFVIAKALMIYHHFRLAAAKLDCNDYTMAAVMLHISIVKNSGKKKFKDVVLTLHEFMCKELPDEERGDTPSENDIMLMRERFTFVEYFVVQTLRFDIDYVVAYSFAESFLLVLQNRLESDIIRVNFNEFVWKFIGQFYLSKRCLLYNAKEIAFGCITLAAKVLALNILDEPKWNQEVSLHMDNKKQEDIMDDLLHVLNVLH